VMTRSLFAAIGIVWAIAITPLTASAADAEIKIGFAVANLRANFFHQIKESIEKAGKEAGVTVITVDADGDPATQVNQVLNLLIDPNIAALIYIPTGSISAALPLVAAKAVGIPTVAIDRNPPGSPADTFIASDSVTGARTLGAWVVQQVGGIGKVAIIQGQLGTTPELDRDQGFNEALAEAPGMQVVTKQASAAWQQDEGFAITQDILQRDPSITVIFGRADALALGAAQAVKLAHLDHKVLVVGFDGDVTGLKAIQNGVLDATMTQRPQQIGRMALHSALDLIAHKPVPPVQLQQTTLTTRENVAQFIDNHP